jgi:hypothetical protein
MAITASDLVEPTGGPAPNHEIDPVKSENGIRLENGLPNRPTPYGDPLSQKPVRVAFP